MSAAILRIILAYLFIASVPVVSSATQAAEARKFDEFNYAPPYSDCDITARLDEYWKVLKDNPDWRAYIVGYSGRRRPLKRVAYPPNSWRDYLVEARELRADHVVVINGGLREEPMVELWLVPPGAEPPKPTPTVLPKGRRRQ
jgi:hypothetical protein